MLEEKTGLVFQSIKHALKNGESGSISFFEIYMGGIGDLLDDNRNVNLLERNKDVYASSICQKPYKTFEEAREIINEVRR